MWILFKEENTLKLFGRFWEDDYVSSVILDLNFNIKIYRVKIVKLKIYR